MWDPAIKNLNKKDRQVNGNIFSEYLNDQMSDDDIPLMDRVLEVRSDLFQAEKNYVDFPLLKVQNKKDHTNFEVLITPTVSENSFKIENEQEKMFLSSSFIHSTTYNATGKKKYSRKQHSCLYCRKLITKVPEHFERNHSEEKDVKEMLNYPKKSIERARIIEILRKKGNYYHNQSVLQNKKGVFLPKSKNCKTSSIDEYIACDYCLGYYPKGTVSEHVRKCRGRFLVFNKNY